MRYCILDDPLHPTSIDALAFCTLQTTCALPLVLRRCVLPTANSLADRFAGARLLTPAAHTPFVADGRRPPALPFTMPASVSPSRPKTPLSRPGTSTSKSVSGETSSGATDGHVVALIEGNAIGREVGIATYAPTTGRVTLSQLADSLSFARTLHHVGCHPPDWLLVTDTAFPSAVEGAPRAGSRPGARGKTTKREPTRLVCSLMDAWQDTEIVPVARKYWTDEAGTLPLSAGPDGPRGKLTPPSPLPQAKVSSRSLRLTCGAPLGLRGDRLPVADRRRGHSRTRTGQPCSWRRSRSRPSSRAQRIHLPPDTD